MRNCRSPAPALYRGVRVVRGSPLWHALRDGDRRLADRILLEEDAYRRPHELGPLGPLARRVRSLGRRWLTAEAP